MKIATVIWFVIAALGFVLGGWGLVAYFITKDCKWAVMSSIGSGCFIVCFLCFLLSGFLVELFEVPDKPVPKPKKFIKNKENETGHN